MSLADLKVLAYVPNIVDYFRFLLLYIGYTHYQVHQDPYVFAGLYALSYGLDAIDGPIARYLKQTSKLGIYLDMLADRVSSCLLLHLAAQSVLMNHTRGWNNLERASSNMEELFYFNLAGFLYFCLIFVEIVSHGVVMIQSEVFGMHQKEMQADSWLVQIYLGNKTVLFCSCALFEFAGLSLFLDLPITIFLLTSPAFVFRALANLRRLLDVTIFRFDFSTKKQEEQKKSK